MRKKFIGVYALMAVLALGTTVTSCVDDKESAAVTEIRNLKLKRLQALADLAEAQATIEKIQAQLAENTYDAELAAKLAEAEARKALAEAQLNESLNSIQNNLLQNYTDAIDNVEDLTKEIAKAKLGKAELEADKSKLEAIANNKIVDEKQNLAKAEAQLAAYEAMEENNIDELKAEKEKLDIQVRENTAAQTVKSNEETEARNAFDTAKAELVRRTATNVSGTQVTPSFVGIDDVINAGDKVLEPTNKVAAAIYALDDVMDDLRFDSGESDDAYVASLPSGDSFLKSETVGEGDASITIYSLVASGEFTATDLIAKEVAKLKETVDGSEETITKAEETLTKAQEALTKAQEAYDKAETKKEEATTAKEAADKAVTDLDEEIADLTQEMADYISDGGQASDQEYKDMEKSKKAKEDLLVVKKADAADAEKAYNSAVADFNKAETTLGDKDSGAFKAFNDAQDGLAKAQSGAVTNQKKYDNLVAAQKKYTDAVAIIKNEADYKAYADRAAKIVETEGAAMETKAEELLDLKIAAAELQGKLSAINGLIGEADGLIDINKEIAQCKEDIETAKAAIATLEMIKGGESGDEAEMLYEDVLAMYDQQIENAEAELAIAEKLAQDYKARLEAAINAE